MILDYVRAQKKIHQIIKRATAERDIKGYRENLGYDQQNALEKFLDTLELTYPKRAELIQEFYRLCATI